MFSVVARPTMACSSINGRTERNPPTFPTPRVSDRCEKAAKTPFRFCCTMISCHTRDMCYVNSDSIILRNTEKSSFQPLLAMFTPIWKCFCLHTLKSLCKDICKTLFTITPQNYSFSCSYSYFTHCII